METIQAQSDEKLKGVLGFETNRSRVWRGSRFNSSGLPLNCFPRLTLTCPADILSRSRERGILLSARQVSAVELNSFQNLTEQKDSIMQKRKLGNLEVSAIGLGCMGTFQMRNSEF